MITIHSSFLYAHGLLQGLTYSGAIWGIQYLHVFFYQNIHLFMAFLAEFENCSWEISLEFNSSSCSQILTGSLRIGKFSSLFFLLLLANPTIQDILQVVENAKTAKREAKLLLESAHLQTIAKLEHVDAQLHAAERAITSARIIFTQVAGVDDIPENEREEIVKKMTNMSRKIRTLLEETEAAISIIEHREQYRVGEERSGAQGRPSKVIGVDQLETLLQLGFTLTAIASLLGEQNFTTVST